MPVYRGDDLARLVNDAEKRGERVVWAQLIDDGWVVIAHPPADDTGRPHLPSWAKETR